MNTSGLTAEKYHQPPIPLVDLDTGEKIKLRLRKMSFAREISSLPSDLLQLHEILIQQRANRNQSIYKMVSAWNKLQVYERFWESFKFSSESDYLAYYGFPDGTTLAGWTVMVNFFDKATFVLLGDQVLSYMMRAVGQYQQDTDTRKRDYQAIFDRYCAQYEGFDKSAFFDVVRRYVEETYEEPLAGREKLTLVQWRRQKTVFNSAKIPRRTRERVVVEATRKQEFGPRVTHDFNWETEECPSCVSKVKVIKAYQKYTKKLEEIIRRMIGEKHLPKRPPELEGL